MSNLKVYVDNVESITGSSGSEEDVVDLADSDIDMKDVELNVYLGDMSKSGVANNYKKKVGNFITDIDISSEEVQKRRADRTKRFGVKDKGATCAVDIAALYRSLGLTKEDVSASDTELRTEAIYFRGVDDMSTKDVLEYFRDYAPAAIEWIDDIACIVVWEDSNTSARVMFSCSKEIIYDSASKSKLVSKESASEGKGNKTGSNAAGKGQDTEEDDDILDLEKDPDESMEEDAMDVSVTQAAEKANETENTPPAPPSVCIEELMDQNIQLPAGRWRLADPHLNADVLLMRFATKADKKELGAEKKSNYYRKYGNPNYDDLPGLISESRKRRLRGQKIHKEPERKDKSESEPEEGEIRSEPEDLRELLEERRVKGDASGSDSDDLDMEAEVRRLLKPPAAKRLTKRMYADEMEDNLQSKRNHTGLITVTTAQTVKERLSLEGGATKPSQTKPSVMERLGRSSKRTTDLRHMISRGFRVSNVLISRREHGQPQLF
ncbi:PREDICTED: uncharacterized protein C17orf85 homolog [Priapulus caudatus]|uniref:Nuclear cap-binding protein subunit 3 n=1 Tax=Priapulus caudatus TaxID=37621 RepID=A0ABM1E380_PRICU|nr:PREDICTED: uncharacterized protein C17orf85 homolog [Priapulus caudatus]